MANHLVIGLGGTGGSVLCALRKRIYEEFRSNEPDGNAHIEYLYVDSSLADLNNEANWMTLGASVQLSPAQRLSINGIGAGVLNELEAYPGINAFINKSDKKMLQDGIGAIINEGIGGQRRRFGRMLFANNMRGLPQNTFVGQVHSRVRALREVEDVEDVTFHICAGLGGGTGSGSIIDAVAQIRNEFQRTGDDRNKYKIQLYLYVPEQIIQIPGGEDSNRYYQPNGYAALLELNAMSVGKYFPTDVKGNTDEYGNVRRLLKGQDAFDMAYLYTNVNEMGRQVNIHTVLPCIVGDFLFQKIVVSSIDEKGKMSRLETGENNGMLPEKNEEDEAVHSRKFMTFGVKRIEYPETEVVEFGAYQFARQASLQMLNGLWDDVRGFLDECTEDMVGKTYKADIAKDETHVANLLSDDYLMLEMPLPSIEKNVKNWKLISQGWEFYIDRYKLDVKQDNPKENWLPLFNELCNKFYSSMYRGSGVKKFYEEYSNEIPGFAEEITRRVENNLFTQWKDGDMSIIEVHKYITLLIADCDARIEKFNVREGHLSAYLKDDLSDKITQIRDEWKHRGIFDSSAKILDRFAETKRDELTTMTQIEGIKYAVRLLTEVRTQLTLLNMNGVEPFKKTLGDFADNMKKLAAEKCKLSDNETDNIQGDVVKEYDPKTVRNTVVGFLKNYQRQKDCATALRQLIIDSVGASEVTFSLLGKKMTAGALLSITLKTCIEYARKDMDDFSVKNPNQRLVKVNILDKLRYTYCNTPENMAKFTRSIYQSAQSFLKFNGSEEGQGSPETAANHQKMIQISLPLYDEDDEFRNDFITAFGNSGNIAFNRQDDVSVNFKSNQIVVITAHSGFPLRYVDNVRVLKQKYDVLVRSDVNRMVVHTESFKTPLPDLYVVSGKDKEKYMRPYVFMAYCLDGLLVDKKNPETGEEYKAFAGEKNKMGLVSRWITVGENIFETLEIMCKSTHALDAKALRAAVKNEINTNYKHIEKKEALMRKMGEFLTNELLPLCNGNEGNPNFAAFNKTAEELCDNEFKNI